MNNNRKEYRKRFKNCEQNLKEKLFLTSYDLMSLNVSSRLIFQAYILLDFLFLVHSPLEYIYKTSKSTQHNIDSKAHDIVKEIVINFNPADRLLGYLSYSNIKICIIIVIAYTVISFGVLMALVCTRNKKKLNITNNKKFISKAVGLVITFTNFFIYVPLLSFTTIMFYCSPEETNCYRGTHLLLMCLSIIAFILQFLIAFFSESLMTSSYPNESISWSHFPSKIQYFKILFKIAVIIVYQADTTQVITIYANAIFTLCLLGFIYQRLTKAQTFDRSVQSLHLITETVLLLLFLLAFFTDLIRIPVNTVFSVCLAISIIGVSMFINFIKNKSRIRFLKKIDIFNYREEFDALHMMMALHELIETSQFDENEEFLLRGFVERHIEICDFPDCNCLEYYKIINSAYRIQLATIATMKEDENNKSSVSTLNKATYEDETASDDQSMQKTFFVKSKNIVKQNKQRTKFMNDFLINNIKVFLELFPNSVKLRYMSAFIYFNLFKNSFKALYELSFTKTLKSDLGETYDSYTLGLKIIQYFTNRVNSFLSKESKILDLEIDLRQIIEFEKLNIRYQKSIEHTSEVTEEFWLELNKKNVNIDSIFRLGQKINSEFSLIKKKYKKLMSINNNYLEVAYLYKLFVSLCLNYELEESEAKMEITKILQAKGMKKKNLRVEYSKINYSDENSMIIISGCQKDFSKILAMNNKAERIFGYNTSELINHSLTKLQPLVYGYSHDDFILNYINSKRKINKEKHNFVWGKHKSGFVMPLVMDISPYVTFEYNLCFIAFCKRSILLEMYPLKEVLDAQDVFVLLSDQRGIITDMTRNITEWLGFPLQALQKDIALDQIFDGILDDEYEKEFQDGKKIDFFMNSFKDALDDFENRSDDEFESTLYMKEKKCRALVWMKIHEHPLATQYYHQIGHQAGSMIGTLGGSATSGVAHTASNLIVREVWFVLLEEEAATATATTSFLDTKNTHESAMEKEELKFTYQEDREEITSLASVSSLAGYGSFDKGLIIKLSEIKTSTVDETKPRSISLLQKSLVVVFFLSVLFAVVILVSALLKDKKFYSELNIINDSTISTIGYWNIGMTMREIVNIANNDQSDTSNVINGTVSTYYKSFLYNQSDQFRIVRTQLENADMVLSSVDQAYKDQSVYMSYLRQDGVYYTLQKSVDIAFYEIITQAQDISQSTDLSSLQLNRSVFFATSKSQLSNLVDNQRSVFFIINNTIQQKLGTYSVGMSNLYLNEAQENIKTNEILFNAITYIAIAITFFTAVLIIPIILRIESNKEKVFFIYAELSKNDIDDRKRNIRIFFAKLRQSTNNPGGSLFYQKSSRIVSSRLLTKKFSIKDDSNVPLVSSMMGLTRQQPVKGDGTSGGSSPLIDKNNGEYEEDIRAEMIKQQEELEAAVYKKFFHRKIKQMSCIKKLKYSLLILLFACLVGGYFIISNQLITNIGNQIVQSLDYYKIIALRDPYLSTLIAFYRENISLNHTQLGTAAPYYNIDVVQAMITRTLDNEKQYNNLRQQMPQVLLGAENYINKIEGKGMCQTLNNTLDQANCATALNGILLQGMTQTISTVISQITQSIINFKTDRLTNTGLKQTINNTLTRDLLNLKFLYMDEVLKDLLTETTNSITSYFQSMEKTLIIVFICFILLMVIGVFVSVTWGMDYLYRHFNATKSILNLIPGKSLLELSEKTDLKKIQF